MNATLKKGDRVRAQWFEAYVASIAGMQPKMPVRDYTLTGVVRHIRGDHPTNPTEIRVYVDPDGEFDGKFEQAYGCTCGRQHVALKVEWIKEVVDGLG